MDKRMLASLQEHAAPTSKLPVQYIITSSIEVVNNKEILFMSFFNQKEIKEAADFKVFICGEEYISQKLQGKGQCKWYKWSNACIENLIGYWYWNPTLKAACVTLKERENISSFLKSKCINAGEELKIIDNFQKRIMSEKLNAKHEKIKKCIDEAMDKVQTLPKDFEKWIWNGPFGFSRYIYYKREGRKIVAFCTECNKEFAINETKFTKEKIKHNNNGTCPQCNKKVMYKAVGKSTNIYDNAKFAIIQKYEDGLIVRHFSGTKTYREHYKNPSLSYHEYIRDIYHISNGSISSKRYEHTYFLGTGEVRWCDNNSKFQIPKAYFYTRNLNTVLKGTKFQYSCLYNYAKEVKYLYARTFLEEYLKHPGIEYLIKFKLYRLVSDNLNTNWYTPAWDGVNFKGKGIKEVFGIDKELFQQMQRLNLGNEGLNLIKTSTERGKPLTDQQVKWILNNVQINQFITMLNYSTSHKIINYIKKQSSNEYIPENILSDWCDYIGQCKTLKFDLNNSFVLYPRDLKEKHEEYTIMTKSKGLEKYNKKVEKAFNKLNEVYSYNDKKFSIRPANSVNEIVIEGHKQRHCVGGINYVKRMAEGDIAIMLIRTIEQPEVPFYTLELNLKTLNVNQCRGYKNSGKTEEIEKFIDKWKSKKLSIKNRKKVV